MFSRLRHRRSSHTTVVAYLSLFLVIGGGTAFASHLIVRSSDIVDNEVRSRDVRNDNLSGGGLGSRDIRPNALTGSDINESRLG
jgi:hypothetical protein